MRKKDFNNTYASKPETFSENMNESTGTYTKSSPLGGIKTENKDFVQINIKYQSELAELALTDCVARAIFDLFITRMENNNTYITSTTKLAEAVNKSQRTIKRSIATLKERNFIVTYLKIKENYGAVYFINPQIACKCSAGQKQFLIDKYLTLVNDKTYKASENNINIKALVDKDRLVLKSDEKRQLDILNRPDNVKVHGLVQLANLFNDMSQQEILDVIQLLNKKIPVTDEELEKTEEDIDRREKAIALMNRQKELIETEAYTALALQSTKNKFENKTIQSDKGIEKGQYIRFKKAGKVYKVVTDGLEEVTGYISADIRYSVIEVDDEQYKNVRISQPEKLQQNNINCQQSPTIVCIGGKWGKITTDGFEEVTDYIQPDVGDPFGMLDGSNDYTDDYKQSEIISMANYKKEYETEADRIIKDLMYRSVLDKLEKQGIEIQTDDWNKEDSVYWTQRINTMLDDDLEKEDEKEQYIYVVDKWYKGTKTGLIEAPNYMPQGA